jgi:hypothetical protein
MKTELKGYADDLMRGMLIEKEYPLYPAAMIAAMHGFFMH